MIGEGDKYHYFLINNDQGTSFFLDVAGEDDVTPIFKVGGKILLILEGTEGQKEHFLM